VVAYAARLDAATVRAAGWAFLALRRLRSAVRAHGLAARPAPPPALPAHAVRGVAIAVRIAGANCLERSLLIQEWLMAQGSSHDVKVGVMRAEGRFCAHAWIAAYEDDPPGYVVVTTLQPRANPLAQTDLTA
jgi:hypothetical protein